MKMKKPADMSFPEQLQLIRSSDIGVPRKLVIDLAVAQTDYEYSLSANMFYIMEAPDGVVYIDVKFNKLNQDQHRLHRQMGIMTPFSSVFITTPAAQLGTMTIIFGTEAPTLLRVIDNRSATSLDMAQIRAELQGDVTPENFGGEFTVGNGAAVEIIAANVARKGCMIQAKSTNAGIVYIGFDNTVLPNLWVAELTAGMSITIDDYRGDLYARASAAGQLVGWGEW